MFSEVPPFSPKYLLSLILHLPSDGAFFASRRGGQQYRGWDASRYALVAMVNAQRAGNHIQLMVNRDPKKRAPEPPDPFPTPDEETKQSSTSKPGSFAAIAASIIAAQKRKEQLVNDS